MSELESYERMTRAEKRDFLRRAPETTPATIARLEAENGALRQELRTLQTDYDDSALATANTEADLQRDAEGWVLQIAELVDARKQAEAENARLREVVRVLTEVEVAARTQAKRERGK